MSRSPIDVYVSLNPDDATAVVYRGEDVATWPATSAGRAHNWHGVTRFTDFWVMDPETGAVYYGRGSYGDGPARRLTSPTASAAALESIIRGLDHAAHEYADATAADDPSPAAHRATYWRNLNAATYSYRVGQADARECDAAIDAARAAAQAATAWRYDDIAASIPGAEAIADACDRAATRARAEADAARTRMTDARREHVHACQAADDANTRANAAWRDAYTRAITDFWTTYPDDAKDRATATATLAHLRSADLKAALAVARVARAAGRSAACAHDRAASSARRADFSARAAADPTRVSSGYPDGRPLPQRALSYAQDARQAYLDAYAADPLSSHTTAAAQAAAAAQSNAAQFAAQFAASQSAAARVA